jgi:serine/threonine protein kinase
VIKIQRRNIQKLDIEDAVREIAINKLCSALEIGPAVETRIPFDVVVYTDAVQFHLEKCEPLGTPILVEYGQYLESDIIECLKVSHSKGIVHRDIKPPNILWSKQWQKFVLCDFGLSISVT